MSQCPLGFGQWFQALTHALSKPREIAIVGDPDSADTQALLSVVRDGYRLFQEVALGLPTTKLPAVPLLQDRGLVEGPSPVPWTRSLRMPRFHLPGISHQPGHNQVAAGDTVIDRTHMSQRVRSKELTFLSSSVGYRSSSAGLCPPRRRSNTSRRVGPGLVSEVRARTAAADTRGPTSTPCHNADDVTCLLLRLLDAVQTG
jgi:hypothetical protein